MRKRIAPLAPAPGPPSAGRLLTKHFFFIIRNGILPAREGYAMTANRTGPLDRRGSCGKRVFDLLKESEEDEADVRILSREEAEENEGRREPLRCRGCGNEVTAAEFGIRRHGRFEHTFDNPAGYTFRLGCFSNAWNCLLHGVPTHAFTWFPGFRWRFCSCGHCGLHLGWHYDSGAESFFGLILDNLIRQSYEH